MTTPRRAPRVLITNDDGPPSPNSSPFVYPFAQALAKELGWEVKVVVPSTQKSWVGKGYLIAQTTTGEYYYPVGKDGYEGERSVLPRPLKKELGETMEWVLVDGTPATCSNLGLYSLYPPGSFDLVIAGPNFGRNTSTAFALSSGTIGSAMAASLSGIPSIALSFGLMTDYKPPTQDLVEGAILASCKVVKQLWELGWGEEGKDRVDVYTVNVPIMPTMIQPGGPEVHWTHMARTNYQRLFKSVSKAPSLTDVGGPSAIPETVSETKVTDVTADIPELASEHATRPLKYVFSPDIGSLINPSPSTLEEGSDTHSLHGGAIAVTPIRAAFEPARVPSGLAVNHGFKWNL